MRLAIVATHPVQYNSPWFRLLTEAHGIEVRVFYTWNDGNQDVVDPGFGKKITWDIPLTDGYSWEFVAPSQPIKRRTFWNMDSPNLLARLKGFSPDAILVLGWNYRSHLRAMRYYHGRIPVLFRGDSTLLDCRHDVRDLIRTIALRSVYRNVDVALSVGTNNTDYFLRYGLCPNQIVVVPHAIDNQRFSGNGQAFDDQAAQLRHELGFTDEQIVVLFAGKFEPKKSPDGLIRAYQKAIQQRQNLRLLIVGNGPMEKALRLQSSQLPGVVFLPFQNQSRIPVIYRIGDLTVLPSLYNETWGLCLNEAMASGRLILASNKVGAARDLVREGVTGFSFQTNDESLTNALVNLPNRVEILKMGVTCQSFVREWSFDVLCRRIADLLKTSPCVNREPHR